MLKTATTFAIFVSLILTGAIAGFFYAFSVTVMPGLDLAAPAVAIEAMQKINEAVRNPVFFVTFFLTPVFCAVAGIGAGLGGARVAAACLLGAAAIYMVAAFLPTAQINVPMNRALDHVSPTTPDGAAVWAEYTARWTWWNTARTVASLVSLLLVGVGIATWAAHVLRDAESR